MIPYTYTQAVDHTASIETKYRNNPNGSNDLVHPLTGKSSLIIGQSASGHTDFRGNNVSAKNLYGFNINNDKSSTNDKTKVVFMGGNHAGEHSANYVQQGAIDFLLESAIGQALLNHAEFNIYPMVDPEGRYSGHTRSNDSPTGSINGSTGTVEHLTKPGHYIIDDHNRFWDETGALNQPFTNIQTVRDQIKLDNPTGTADWFFDFHSDSASIKNSTTGSPYLGKDQFKIYKTVDLTKAGVLESVLNTFIDSLQEAFPENLKLHDVPGYDQYTPVGVSDAWAIEDLDLDIKYAFTPETPSFITYDGQLQKEDFYKQQGENYIRALTAVILDAKGLDLAFWNETADTSWNTAQWKSVTRQNKDAPIATDGTNDASNTYVFIGGSGSTPAAVYTGPTSATTVKSLDVANATLKLSNNINFTVQSNEAGYTAISSTKIRENATINITNGTINLGDAKMIIGVKGDTDTIVDGTLNISSQATVTNHSVEIAQLAGSTGKATITGSTATWAIANGIDVGLHGDGTLEINSGATLTSGSANIATEDSSTGTVTVDGTNSSWAITNKLTVGKHGNGTLNVFNGAKANNIVTLRVGHYINSYGELNIDSQGSNTLTQVNSKTLTIGQGGDGQVTVDGDNAELNINFGIHIGFYGTGSLNIQNGASVTNDKTHIGQITKGNGELNIDGANSTWNTNSLKLGTYHIISSGRKVVNNFQTPTISSASEPNPSGTANIINGNTTVNTYTIIGNAGILNITGGSFTTNSLTTYESHVPFSYSAQLIHDGGTLAIQGGTLNVIQNTFIRGEKASGAATLILATTDFNINGDNNPILRLNDDATFDLGTRNLNVSLDQFGTNTNTLQINSGSTVSAHTATIGKNSGAIGIIDIDGVSTSDASASTLTIANILTIGKYGTGTINLTNNAKLITGGAHMSFNTTGVSTVNVLSNSIWTNGGIAVGFDGTATLNINSGGILNSTSSDLGLIGPSSGTANISGSTSQWNTTNDLNVGLFGQALITIDDNASVTSANTYIAKYTNSTGQITSTNGGSFTTGNLIVGGSDTTQGGTATIALSDDSTIDLTGDLTLWDSSTLEFDLSALSEYDATTNQFAFFDITGNADIDGDLSVSYNSLTLGDEYRLMDIDGTTTGTFNNLAQYAQVGTYYSLELIISYTGGDGQRHRTHRKRKS